MEEICTRQGVHQAPRISHHQCDELIFQAAKVLLELCVLKFEDCRCVDCMAETIWQTGDLFASIHDVVTDLKREQAAQQARPDGSNAKTREKNAPEPTGDVKSQHVPTVPRRRSHTRDEAA